MQSILDVQIPVAFHPGGDGVPEEIAAGQEGQDRPQGRRGQAEDGAQEGTEEEPGDDREGHPR